MIQIKITPLRDGALMPKRATKGSAGYDISCPCDYELKFGRQVIPLGWALEMPINISVDCRSRSGNSAKGLAVINDYGEEDRIDADVTLGLIDSDYRNEIGAIVHVREESARHCGYKISKGQALAQLKFSYVPDTELVLSESLSSSERTGGFGSTDSK